MRLFCKKRREIRQRVGKVRPLLFRHIERMTMIQKPALTLEDIKRMAAACEQEASRNQWAVTFAIVDEGGHLLWLQRLDGAAPRHGR